MGLWRSQVAHRTLNPVVEGPNPSRPALFFVIKIRPISNNYMDIKVDDMEGSAYSNFAESIKSRREIEHMTDLFVRLARENIDVAKGVIISYINIQKSP